MVKDFILNNIETKYPIPAPAFRQPDLVASFKRSFTC